MLSPKLRREGSRSPSPEGQDRQQREIREADPSTAPPSDDNILQRTAKERQLGREQQPGSRVLTRVGSFESVHHSDSELGEEPELVESRPGCSEVNQNSFQKWVEAYQKNNLTEYLGNKSWPSRFLQENTITSLLNEQRLGRYQRDIYTDYGKEVDKIYKETRETISQRYEKDIKDIKDSIKDCKEYIKVWRNTRDKFMQKRFKAELKEKSPDEKAKLKEKSPDEKAELKEKLEAINKVINEYREDLNTLHELEKCLNETADKEISEISKLKVEGLQKTVLDGQLKSLEVEQKYQVERRNMMAGFGKMRSAFMARSLFRFG
jgi:hypothetical protein